MDRISRPQDIRRVPGEFPIEYTYTAGVAVERFLREIKDNARIVGSRCESCDVVYVPTRLFCERCFAELTSTVEIDPFGEILSHTTVHYGKDGFPLLKPQTIALIGFKGTVGGLVHRLESPSPIAVGLKVRPEFLPANQRVGSILDIRCFVPA